MIIMYIYLILILAGCLSKKEKTLVYKVRVRNNISCSLKEEEIIGIKEENKEIINNLICKNRIDETDGRGRTALHLAIEEGNESLARLFVKNGASLRLEDEYGERAIHKIVKDEDMDLDFVLRGSNIEAKDRLGRRPLMVAASMSNIKAMNALLNKGANILAKDEDKSTALHFASLWSDRNGLELLLKFGADLEAKDKTKKTPLMVSVDSNGEANMEYLLRKGANIDARDYAGLTPLMKCINGKRYSKIELLIKKGASLKRKNKDGKTAQDMEGNQIIKSLLKGNKRRYIEKDREKEIEIGRLVVNGMLKKLRDEIERGVNLKNDENGFYLFLAVVNNRDEIIEEFIKLKLNLNRADRIGRTALNWASRVGHTKIVEVLINGGADFNKASVDGQTPLYSASKKGHEDIVDIFLEQKGIDKEKGPEGSTPLNIAAQMGHIKVVRMLLLEGVDVNARDNSGRTILYNAALMGGIEIVKMLLKEEGINIEEGQRHQKFHITPLGAAAMNNWAIAKIFIKAGANLHSADEIFVTPLQCAASNGNLRVVRMLLKQKDIEIDEGKTSTPLAIAANNGHISVVKLFIKEGANINDASSNGSTALFNASVHGHLEIVEILLKEGATDKESKDGIWNSLSAASRNGHIDVVKKLLISGIDANSYGTNGSTPLQHAAFKGHMEIVKLLIEKGANPNKKGNSNCSPLVEVVRRGNIAMATLLIEKGAHDYSEAMKIALQIGNAIIQGLILSVFVEDLDSTCIPWSVKNQLEKAEQDLKMLPIFDFYDTFLSKRTVFFLPPEIVLEIFKYLDVRYRIELLFLYSNRDFSQEEIEDIEKRHWYRHIPINKRDENGLTMLHKLCYYGHKNKIDFLVRKGVMKNMEDKEGKTPLWYAKKGAILERIVDKEGNRLVRLKKKSVEWIEELKELGFI